MKSQPVNIILIYKRPTTNRENFVEALCKTLRATNTTEPTLLCGDFNIDLLSDSADPHITNSLEKLGFRQLVTQATTDYGSLLDHVSSNCPSWETSVEIMDCYFSDHDFVCVCMEAK